MPTIEVRVDVTGIPHTFIVITDDNGHQEGWGFAPKEAGDTFGPGNIYDDTNHVYDFSTTPQELTQQQYQDLKNFIQTSIDNPPYYSLPGDWVPPENNNNCSTWVIDAFNSANIPDVLGVTNDFVWNPFGQSIFIILNDLFNTTIETLSPSDSFENAEATLSPIVLDLDGDGIETLSQDSNVHFDHDNNGMAERTGWVDSDDGLLVLDKNLDGIINDGSELFGNNTVLNDGSLANNGYDALAALDDNSDGVIDSQDAVFTDLRVWQDVNSDGISQSNELFTLEDSGIQSIKTDYETTSVSDGNGNTIKQTSDANLSDGATIETADVWFSVNKTYTVDRNTVELSEELMALPDAEAFGNVRSLRQTMANDSVLTDLITQFTNASTDGERYGLVDDIIYQWTGSADIDPYSRDPSKVYGHVMDARQLVTLENLVGRGYVGTWCWGEHDPNPHGQAAPKLIAEYQKFKSYVTAQLMSQTVFNDAFANISITYNFDSQAFEPDLTEFKAYLTTLLPADEDSIIGALNVLLGLSTYSSQMQTQYDLIKSDPILGVYTFDTSIYGEEFSESLAGTNNDDFMQGNGGDDSLFGGAGNDQYTFNINDGSDRIYDSSGNDRLNFGEGISVESISVTRDPTSLFITILDLNGQITTDKIQIDNVFDFDGSIVSSAIEHFHFFDNTSITLADLIDSKLTQVVTEDDDFLYGTNADDVIHGQGGNDYIYAGGGNNSVFGDLGDDFIQSGDENDHLYGGEGSDNLASGAGNDFLYGNAGDDILNGGAGNDLLAGGTGDDVLIGGQGSDTFFIAADGSHDRIKQQNQEENGVNRILFDVGINIADVNFERSGKDLLISINKNALLTTVIIENGFISTNNLIEAFEFEAGEVLTIETVLSEASNWTGNDEDEVAYGYYGNDNMNGAKGNDSLYGNGGDDNLIGGTGDDFLYGGEGNDSLTGGDGDDYLEGNNGEDSYFISAGTGTTTIYNYDSDQTSADVIHFLQGIEPQNVEVHREQNDLILTLDSNSNQKVVVKQYFAGTHFSQSSEHSIIDSIHFYDGTIWTTETIKSKALISTESNDIIKGYYANDFLDGGDGDDTLYGYAGNDTLNGSLGNDRLHGGDGDDTLIGGKGNDQLYGGGGSDTYKIELGSGTTNIYDNASESNTASTLEFLEGIDPEDVEVSRIGSDLQFTLPGNQIVNINYYFMGVGVENETQSYLIDDIRFSDGTKWDLTTILSKIHSITESSDLIHGFTSDDNFDALGGNDTVYGYDGNDTIIGGDGNDSLYGGNGNDILIGGEGRDYLEGNNGDDTIVTGLGDDIVKGGEGADTYQIQRNNALGVTRINNYDESTSVDDTIQFMEGIDPDDVQISRNQSTLILKIGDAGEQVVYVSNYFYSTGSLNPATNGNGIVSKISFHNGVIWDTDTINSMVNKITSEADTIHGYATDDNYDGGAGDDLLYGYDGDDLLAGGLGSDSLYGGNGNDTLVGGEGNDHLEGGNGSNLYIYQRGDGVDTIKTTSGDILRLGLGINPADVTFHRNGNSELVLVIDGQANSQIIINGEDLEQLQFDNGDGVTWSNADIQNVIQAGIYNTQYGTSADDEFTVDHSSDVIIEAENSGIDTVFASRSYSLSENIENLTLTGLLNINATGNELK